MSEEPVELELVSESALETLTRSEIDVQISTAKKYPRALGKVKEQMLAFATLDQETAESCMYAKPQGGSVVKGPSVRLAEIAVSSFQNIRAGARVIANDGKTITCQGVCHDLENNTCVSVEVKRSILKKNGDPYPEHMVVTSGNAGCSIALRNAVFKVVPMALVKPAYEAAKALAIGDAASLSDRRTKMVEHFKKMGVTEEKICAAVSRETVEDITLKDLEKLIGFSSSIKNGDATIDEVFPEDPTSSKPSFDPEAVKKKTAPPKKKAAKQPAPLDTLKAKMRENDDMAPADVMALLHQHNVVEDPDAALSTLNDEQIEKAIELF